MRILYIDCSMGAAGDMLAAALTELTDREAFLKAMRGAFPPSMEFAAEDDVKGGIKGTRFSVKILGEEEGNSDIRRDLSAIGDVINALNVAEDVKKDAIMVYRRLADAEAQVHNQPVERIHFHEVGDLDAIADIVGVCYLIKELKPDRIICSPICLGGGTVRCAHGVMTVPTPATAVLTRGVPTYGGDIMTELCTPTGATLLTHFADEYGSMPLMTVTKIGYGMGKKDFRRPNAVRAFLGETLDKPSDRVVELRCNVDDMTGEELAYAMNKLIKGGARDAYTTPVFGKKSRPGFLITCLCGENDSQKFAQLLLRHTSTLGVRVDVCDRYTLNKHIRTADSAFGKVRIKDSDGYGAQKSKIEFDDLATIADESGLTIGEVRQTIVDSLKEE